MKLEDLLVEENIHIPLAASSVGEGLSRLLPVDGRVWGTGDGEALFRRLRSGEGGRVRRVSRIAIIVSLRATEGDEPWAAIGVSPSGLAETASAPDDAEEEPGPRILLVLRLPRRPGFGTGALEGLAGALRDPEVRNGLLGAEGPEDVTGLKRLLETDLDEPLRVEHVLTEMGYRVFPETPLHEVVDLMARRGLRALPVVGEDMQVLGIVTAGDALKYAVERAGRGGDADPGPSGATARDIMSRTVMCVSEDQELFDAAQLMVNRDVTQLPVLREGEIVGMLTRDSVLKALFGGR